MIEMTITDSRGMTPAAQELAAERLDSIPARTELTASGVSVRTTAAAAPAVFRAMNRLYDELYPLAAGEMMLEAGAAGF